MVLLGSLLVRLFLELAKACHTDAVSDGEFYICSKKLHPEEM